MRRSGKLGDADRRLRAAAAALIGIITIVRVIILFVTPLELHPDEAQYWWWSQLPALGYFSKPPLTAWIIHITTALLGDHEWAVRIASPCLHGLTALVICAIGRRVFDSTTGLFGALAYLTAPGVSYSAWLMSTDVPLLLCWACGLYAFLRATDDPGYRWAILCGIAVGIGLLAKYAMIYFFWGVALTAIAGIRKRPLGARSLMIVLIAAVIALPNIWWNLVHGNPAVRNIAANAGWTHPQYSLGSASLFLIGQFGVFGPLLMAGFLAAVLRMVRDRRCSERELILALFSLPPLVLMLVQAFAVSANANWAAPAYVGASPLAVNELMRRARGRALSASFVIDGIATVLLWAALIRPELANMTGLGNAFKREEGWRTLAVQVRDLGAHKEFDAIAADNRSVIAELLYYARPLDPALRAVTGGPIPHDHFQMTMPLLPSKSHVLLVTDSRAAAATLAMFDSKTALAVIAVPVGGHARRLTELYDAYGFRGSVIPHALPGR